MSLFHHTYTMRKCNGSFRGDDSGKYWLNGISSCRSKTKGANNFFTLAVELTKIYIISYIMYGNFFHSFDTQIQHNGPTYFGSSSVASTFREGFLEQLEEETRWSVPIWLQLSWSNERPTQRACSFSLKPDDRKRVAQITQHMFLTRTKARKDIKQWKPHKYLKNPSQT